MSAYRLMNMRLTDLMHIVEQAVSITVDAFHSSISAYRQEADPERKKMWRRLVRDHLAWLRSHEIPKDVSTRSPWILEKQWSTLVRVDLDGETREPHDLNELISWLKQFTRRKRIGQMYITMSCERSPVEVEMDVEKEAGNAATE
uniref:Uncharacterized protein n=1 Tax=Thermosporothrix sp. COM3 TaxID=2490863 RepID=A0A455SFN3_9CHLR|nr:hypothetical protein KTC_20180 [Thermosporothrix sp. COM3]